MDIRLSFSEGRAHYISSAIRNDPQHLDFSTSGVNNFNISVPGSAKGCEIEMAVANALWQASGSGANHTTVLATLQSFKSQLSSKSFASDPISLDTFADMWSGSSLASVYSDRGMSYYADAIAANSALSPSAITNKSSYELTGLSFFPEGNKDYFSFAAVAGDVYSIKTASTANGALTALRVYKNSVASSTISATVCVAKNSAVRARTRSRCSHRPTWKRSSGTSARSGHSTMAQKSCHCWPVAIEMPT